MTDQTKTPGYHLKLAKSYIDEVAEKLVSGDVIGSETSLENDLDLALKQIEKAQSINPNLDDEEGINAANLKAFVYYEKGRIKFFSAKQKESVKLFQKSLTFAEIPEVYHNLGLTYELLQKNKMRLILIRSV